MKRVVTWTLLSAALFGLAATASAVEPARKDKPYLKVSATPERLDLGMVPLMGPREVNGSLTLNVDTNCKLGSIYLSTTPLKHQNGVWIEPENVLVRTSKTQEFVGMKKPVAISPPAEGPNKIVVDVKVVTKAMDPAGDYSGVFTFTVAPPV